MTELKSTRKSCVVGCCGLTHVMADPHDWRIEPSDFGIRGRLRRAWWDRYGRHLSRLNSPVITCRVYGLDIVHASPNGVIGTIKEGLASLPHEFIAELSLPFPLGLTGLESLS